MFDCLPIPGNAALHAVQRFYFDHGHELTDAARLLGGDAAAARAIACGVRLETSSHVDSRIKRDLAAFHRLLALQDVGNPENLETALFSEIDPASKEVETICRLTDRLETLIETIQDPHVTDAGLQVECGELSSSTMT